MRSLVLDHTVKDHQGHTVLSLLLHAFFSTGSFLCATGRFLFRCFPRRAAGVPIVVWFELRLTIGPMRATGLWDVAPVVTIIMRMMGAEERWDRYVSSWQ